MGWQQASPDREREITMANSTRLVSGPLRTERLGNGRRRLLRQLVVQVADDRITVPAGTETDFSSIPWFGRILVRWSKVDVAGVVHDWLYQTGAMTRSDADDIWRLVAIAGDHRANGFQARTAWLGLRLGGWYAWDQHRGGDPSGHATQ